MYHIPQALGRNFKPHKSMICEALLFVGGHRNFCLGPLTDLWTVASCFESNMAALTPKSVQFQFNVSKKDQVMEALLHLTHLLDFQMAEIQMFAK